MTAPTVPAASAGAIPAPNPNLNRVSQGAWTLYDFANTIFSFAVVSGAMGLWLSSDDRLGESTGQIVFGLAIVASVGFNALVSPALGAVSDRGGRRLPFLFAFTAMCIVPTALIGASAPAIGAILFIVANFGYQAALIYYDATLKLVSTATTRGRLSGIGTGVGYCGSIFIGLLIFLADIPVESRFLLTAVLFALFAVPIFVFVRDRPGPDAQRVGVGDVLGSWRQIATTIGHARLVPGLPRFLAGRFFYSDAVNTVIVVMSLVASKAVGLSDRDIVLLLLTLTVVAILMSFAWGYLADRIGPQLTLRAVLASWAVGLVLGALSLSLNGTDPVTGNPVPTATGLSLFVVAGAILGSGLGGVQVADRVFMIRLSPPDKVGEFFGIYGLVGKASQLLGQALYVAIIALFLDTLHTGAYQLAVLSLIVTMLIGLWLIWPVSDRWSGSGEVRGTGEAAGEATGADAPPPRLSPDRVPMDDRG
jgi:UMF1 family MFS transporter